MSTKWNLFLHLHSLPERQQENDEKPTCPLACISCSPSCSRSCCCFVGHSFLAVVVDDVPIVVEEYDVGDSVLDGEDGC